MSWLAHEDPEYLMELVEHLRARSDVEDEERKKEAAKRRAQAQRAKTRAGRKRGLVTEDADLSEIT